MIIVLWGEEKCWKSTMALSFPKPIFHLDTDVGGFERAIWRIEQDGITSKSYPIPIQMEKMLGATKQKGDISIRFTKRVVGYKEIWQEIVMDYVKACQDPKIKTIVIDSATMLWQICHTSLLQEKQEIQLSANPRLPDHLLREKLQPLEFPNDRMRSLIYTARSCNKHLVLTHYPKDVYGQRATEKGIEDYKTGEVEPDGFKHTLAAVDAAIKLERTVKVVVDQQTKKSHKENTVKATFTLCAIPGMGSNAVGLELAEPTYEALANLRDMMLGK